MQLIGPGAMPSWSPDGTQLVFHTYDNPQTICVMNADGTGREKILDHWGSPRWSPCGDRIASIGRDRGIALLDLKTGKEYDIIGGPYSLRHGFSISPNGQRFCFGDYNGGVALADLHEHARQATVRWIVKSGASYHSTWSPDGRRLAFNWQPPQRELGQIFYRDVDPNLADALFSLLALEQIYIWEVDSTNPPRWLPGQDARRRNACPDWSPDGKTILFASQAADKSGEKK
jgi:Tol biopolymer transport system component